MASKIDPGLSKLRGDLLFELQSASVMLAQRALAEERVTPFQVCFLLEAKPTGLVGLVFSLVIK